MTNPLSWLLGASSVLLGLGLLWVNNQPDGERGLYLVILCLAWCAGLFILRTRLRQINLSTIALAACILRFFGLWTEPFTSHDGLRYLADGAALLEGLNLWTYHTSSNRLSSGCDGQSSMSINPILRSTLQSRLDFLQQPQPLDHFMLGGPGKL